MTDLHPLDLTTPEVEEAMDVFYTRLFDKAERRGLSIKGVAICWVVGSHDKQASVTIHMHPDTPQIAADKMAEHLRLSPGEMAAYAGRKQ